MPAISTAVLGLLLLSAFPSTAYAYIDPGSAGLLLQAIIGGAVGALFAIRLYWQKIKKFCGLHVETEDKRATQGRTDD